MGKPDKIDEFHHAVRHATSGQKERANAILKAVGDVLGYASLIESAAASIVDRPTYRLVVSPTGKGPRGGDAYGMGKYLASRGDHRHRGVDYVCEPGQEVVSPINGTVIREAQPYANLHYSGLVIQSSILCVKLFYIEPDFSLLGKPVEQGVTVIGKAQDISAKFVTPGMTPHIHLEVDHIDPEYLRI